MRITYHQKSLIRFETIRIKETKVEKPSTIFSLYIFRIWTMKPIQGPMIMPLSATKLIMSIRKLAMFIKFFDIS